MTPEKSPDLDLRPEGLERLITRVTVERMPPLVVYCGSTSKCAIQFQRAQLYDTIRPDPRMFLTIGCSHLSDAALLQAGIVIDKEALDLLHFQKIQTVDRATRHLGIPGEVCILDLTDSGDRYLGESTLREVEYAQLLLAQGHTLTIRWWSQEQEAVKKVLKDFVGKGGSARRKRRDAPLKTAI